MYPLVLGTSGGSFRPSSSNDSSSQKHKKQVSSSSDDQSSASSSISNTPSPRPVLKKASSLSQQKLSRSNLVTSTTTVIDVVNKQHHVNNTSCPMLVSRSSTIKRPNSKSLHQLNVEKRLGNNASSISSTLLNSMGAESGSSPSPPSSAAPSPAPKLGSLKRSKYNSTETMFIRNVLLAPDTDEIVYCLARAVLLKLKENAQVEEKIYLKAFDERHRKIFDHYYDVTPNFKEVHVFLIDLFTARDLSAECGVMSVVYVDRLFVETGITFDKTNWRPIVFTAVLLASKIWEDANVWNADYAGIFDGLEVDAINILEREFLSKIGFNLVLTPSTYTRYYFELRSLASISDDTFPIKPLDRKVAAMLEARSIGAVEKAKMSLLHGNRSTSLDSYEGATSSLSLEDFRRGYKMSSGFTTENFV